MQLFSALYNLLPEAKEHLDVSPIKDYAGLAVMGFFLGGVVLCAILNEIVHYFTSDSIVHCCDDSSRSSQSSGEELFKPSQSDGYFSINRKQGRRVSQHLRQHLGAMEETPLLSESSRSVSSRRRSSCLSSGEICAGRTPPCFGPTCNGHPISPTKQQCAWNQDLESGQHDPDESEASTTAASPDSEHNHEHDHHHHITPQRSQMLRIGIQTSVAISLHKFPEGFITFLSSHQSKSLGFTLFLAIALHNISEGITLSLPLYMATHSRWKSFLYATALGGLSQPLGATIGYMVTKYEPGTVGIDEALYGAIWGLSSGLMAYVSVVSMLSQAYKQDTSDGRHVTVPFFIGVAIIGLSSGLM